MKCLICQHWYRLMRQNGEVLKGTGICGLKAAAAMRVDDDGCFSAGYFSPDTKELVVDKTWEMGIKRWTDALSQDGENEWIVYSLCKNIEETGVFDNLPQVEAYNTVKAIALANGATLGAIRNGWEEYLCSVQRRRNMGRTRPELNLAQ